MCLMYAQRNGTNDDINNPKLMRLNPNMIIPPKPISVKPYPIIMQSCLLRCLMCVVIVFCYSHVITPCLIARQT